MLNECNGCEYQCNLSHIDICTLGSPCPNQRSTPMTEQEYIQTCTTEQLAEFLTKVILDDKRFRMTMVGGVNETKMWLKQPHTKGDSE